MKVLRFKQSVSAIVHIAIGFLGLPVCHLEWLLEKMNMDLVCLKDMWQADIVRKSFSFIQSRTSGLLYCGRFSLCKLPGIALLEGLDFE